MVSNFDYYEFRASSVWNLFTEPKTIKAKENGDLSESCKTFLHNIFLKEKYGFEKEILKNKYFEKGNLCEQKAIELVNEVMFANEFLTKNTVRKSNGYVTGECDNNEIENTIIDTKCSWDLDTFHNVEITKQYELQVNSYGLLYKATNLYVCYCLLNTPPKLLKDYETWYDYESMIPKEQRLKAEKVKVIDNFESILIEKVNKAREYLNGIKL
jgi:hypothetical protein